MLRNLLIYWLILSKSGDFIRDDWLEARLVFIPDATLFVASSFKTMSVCTLSRTPTYRRYTLQLARHNLAQDLTQQWDGNYKGRICSSTVVKESYVNLAASAVFELENKYQQPQQDYLLFMDRMSLFSNH